MTPETTPEVRSEALRLVSNGVHVLTACLDQTFHAATVTWVTQVAFHPPLVLVALQRNSHLAQTVRKAHRFALNILDANQTILAQKFFHHITLPQDSPDIAGYTFRPSAQNSPLLTDALAWLECRMAAEPESPGDHSLILGEVVGAGIRREGEPMVLWQTPWSYGGLKVS